MNLTKKIVWVTLFSVAMGFLESAVVIYLRQLYYPAGFTFPLLPMPANIALVELWREAATIVMLLAIGVLTGQNRAERIAWFLYSFAIWDIFYYVFLYVFIQWPSSLLTWDILFLLPVPWVGPVLAPVLIAATMIVLALIINYHSHRGRSVALPHRVTGLLIAGSMVAIYSFTADYLHQQGTNMYRSIVQGTPLLTDLANYVPVRFDWLVFGLGEALLLAACVLYVQTLRSRKTLQGR